MATKKKSTGKKAGTTPKRTRATKKTTKRQTKKAVKKTTAVEEEKTVAAAPSEEPPAAAKKKRRRTTARRRKKTTAAKATRADATVAAEPAETPAPPRVIEPLSPGAEVEETDGAIVIRFPPVAPSPFGTSAEPAAKDVSPPPSAPSAPTRTPEPETVEPARAGETTEATGTAVPTATVSEEVETAPEEDSERLLTRSQRRRRRRRRSKEKKTTASSADTGAADHPAPDESSESASDDEPASVPNPAVEAATTFVAEAAFAAAEQDPAPWLEDVQVVKAEGFESEGDRAQAAEPEVVEPEPEEPEAEEPADVSTPVSTEPPTAAETPDQEAPAKDKPRRRRRRPRRSTRHDDGGEAPRAVAAAPEGVAEEEPKEQPAAAPEPTPAGAREMIINTTQREECRIAILEANRLEEIYLERAASENHVGNIYKGAVTNVEPSIQAAFIDFGEGKNGFLHISDLHPEYFPEGARHTENVGRKMPRRNRPPVQRCLRRNQEVLVQVTKEGIGTKGPTLSTYLSIPGRFLVMMPGMRRLGVSRRIEDDASREKLRNVLAALDLPEGMGFIARTAALDRTKRELQNDLSYLTRLWRAVEKRIESESAPAELYRESDLVIRTIRDVFTSDIQRIIVDDSEVMARAREFLSIFSPRSQDIVTLYSDPEPIFHRHRIEAELERLHSRHVPLKSGGSLVIDQTEALVAVDVNSGRFRSEDDAETTAYKINIEAADEIPRQLRLRDLGGVVVCDFIDMRLESHRRDIERRLTENLKKHKERVKVLRTSAFGLIELTRQRQRASLTRSVYRDCRHCRGTGLVKNVESVTLDVMRLIQLAVTREHIRMVEVTVSPDVAFLLQNRKRKLIYGLEEEHRRIVSIRSDPNFSLDQVEITCTDARGRVVPHT